MRKKSFCACAGGLAFFQKAAACLMRRAHIQAEGFTMPDAADLAYATQSAWRISLALFLAGFATFSLLYCVQPLLPVFARHYGISPAASSLSLSLSTGFLAAAIICAAAVSEGLGRRGVMFASMTLAALLNIAAGLAPGWHLLLLARAAEGFVLGGVPAVAMAYLAEEIPPRMLGRAMGIYVAGTAFGGMSGRDSGRVLLLADRAWPGRGERIDRRSGIHRAAAAFAQFRPPAGLRAALPPRRLGRPFAAFGAADAVCHRLSRHGRLRHSL
jgi:MFS family permease